MITIRDIPYDLLRLITSFAIDSGIQQVLIYQSAKCFQRILTLPDKLNIKDLMQMTIPHL